MKKPIILTIIYTLGIGCLSICIGALYPVKNTDDTAEAINIESKIPAADDKNESKQEGNAADNDNDSKPSPTLTSTPTLSPTPASTPTPPPVYELTEGGYPEIEKFFHDYYVAWNSCDYSLIKTLLTDPDNAIPLPELQKETRFLDDIRDSVTYVMKSYEENAYIVYVYYELKYVNIKTTLPRLDKFYLVNDDEGNLKIFTSEMDETLKNYFDERDQDEKVQSIIQMTNEKAKEALNNDVDLRVYVEALYNIKP